jgi:hypothetical protein
MQPNNTYAIAANFVNVLYALSFTCFGAAAMLLMTAVKKLIRF